METWMYVAGWTLVHFVWQGAVIAAGVAIGLYLLRGAAANVRYLLAGAAMVLMLLSLVATAYRVSWPADTPIATLASPASSTSWAVTPFVVRFDPRNGGTPAHRAATESALGRLPRVFPVIVITWLTGVAILLVRLLSGWWRVRVLQRAALAAPPSAWQQAADRLASRLGIRRRVWVADAETVGTPTVIGWWRPVIVLPLAALSGLTPSQADAILAHELAHIRRHDYLVNLLQCVLETVLFYHPAVWWVSHRMRVEREQCCDAVVVDLCADPLDYATALTRLEEARPRDTRFALAATGGRLIDRVRRLLRPRTDEHTPIAHALVTATIIALVVLVVGGGYRGSRHTLQARGRHEIESATPQVPVSTIVSPERHQPVEAAQVQTISPSRNIPAAIATDANVHADAADPQQRAAVDQAERERQLENALRLDNPVTDMTVAAQVNYFQLNRAEYSVTVSMAIPGSELSLVRARGATRTTIQFVGEVKDAYGTFVQHLRNTLEIGLGGDSVAQLATRPIQYEMAFILLPGRYSLRIVARDDETDRIGTFQTSVVIPNLNREEKTLPISTVVLGSQRVPVNDAVQTPNPLVRDGLKLIPSVTRVFSKSQDMYVFLQAYERDATTPQPLVVLVTFYRGGVRVFGTEPLRVTEGWLDARSKAVPVQVSVPLGGLAIGRYECEVEVLETAGSRIAVSRVPVDIVP